MQSTSTTRQTSQQVRPCRRPPVKGLLLPRAPARSCRRLHDLTSLPGLLLLCMDTSTRVLQEDSVLSRPAAVLLLRLLQTQCAPYRCAEEARPKGSGRLCCVSECGRHSSGGICGPRARARRALSAYGPLTSSARPSHPRLLPAAPSSGYTSLPHSLCPHALRS